MDKPEIRSFQRRLNQRRLDRVIMRILKLKVASHTIHIDFSSVTNEYIRKLSHMISTFLVLQLLSTRHVRVAGLVKLRITTIIEKLQLLVKSLIFNIFCGNIPIDERNLKISI